MTRRRLLTVICLFLSVHFAIAYSTLTIPMVRLQTQWSGNGGPFAYRMLPTILWRMSAFVVAPLHRWAPALHFPILNPPFDSNESWFIFLLTFGSMFGTLMVARRLLRSIDSHWAFEWIALGMGYAAYFDTILVLNRNLYYPYDLPALFFFTLLVTLAYRDKPLAMALVLLPAILNKETAVLSIVVYLGLQYRRRATLQLAFIGAGLGAEALLIRLAQTVFIRHFCVACAIQPQDQLHENLHQLTNPLFWVSELSVFGYAYIAAILFWSYVPIQVRRVAVVVNMVWVIAMFFTGILREVRIFSELSALLLLVVGLGVHGCLQQRREVQHQLT